MRLSPHLGDRLIVLALGAALAAACGESINAPDDSTALEPPPAALGPFADRAPWSPAVDLEASAFGAHPNFNTDLFIEGCPFTSRDGKHLFIASNRAGGFGGIDVWVSTRSGPDEPWGEPVNAGPEVNSPVNDFCPTLARDGHTFYFVSNRANDDACGGTDIYVTRWRAGSFDPPRNLGCTVNSEANEFSPFPMPQRGSGPVLYFSSNRGDGVTGDIYMSESRGGEFGPPTLVPGINSPADDGHPNVRRDGLEIYFYSDRSDLGGLGDADIYRATRASWRDAWSTPVNLGPDINSAARETRPSLSWDGSVLYFGSSRNGSSDVFVTTR
jgi:Tol biopolymer transport system component